MTGTDPLRWLHRGGALVLGAFVTTHLAVHLFAVAGPEAHGSALALARKIYRNPLGEAVLLTAIGAQVVSGAWQLRRKPRDPWSWAQSISGAYLLVFLVVHTSAALYTRHGYGLDTDFFWAAGSLAYAPIRYGFMPYYAAAVTALFVHLAAAARVAWPTVPKAALLALPTTGAALGIFIVAVFSGAFYAIAIPAETGRYFAETFGSLGALPDGNHDD